MKKLFLKIGPDSANTAKNSPRSFCQSPQSLEQMGFTGHINEIPHNTGFPMLIPHSIFDRIDLKNPIDPLLRQFLPSKEELQSPSHFVADPLAEAQYQNHPGLIKKYASRVLIIASRTCAVNCRYCFRRSFPYQDIPVSIDSILYNIQLAAQDPQINEIILSGGDPLMRTNEDLLRIAQTIHQFPSLTKLRIHSRVPVVCPERINDDFPELCNSGLSTLFVLHINHPSELNTKTHTAFDLLKRKGYLLLNQSVLLRGVNDSANVLAELSEKLLLQGVLPYYLHLLDQVKGTAHFEVPESEACEILRELQSKVSGYLLPRLVRELPGESSKTIIPF